MTPLDELKRIESVIDLKHTVSGNGLFVDRTTLKQLVADSRELRKLLADKSETNS